MTDYGTCQTLLLCDSVSVLYTITSQVMHHVFQFLSSHNLILWLHIHFKLFISMLRLQRCVGVLMYYVVFVDQYSDFVWVPFMVQIRRVFKMCSFSKICQKTI